MRSLLLLGVALACAASAAAGTSHPTLRVLDRDPLTVLGEGFQPGERVTVTALTGLGPRFARATAVRGSFKVAFRLPAQPCAAAFAVRARGTRGSSTLLQLKTRPCVPPPR
jgi:hypothetical protein